MITLDVICDAYILSPLYPSRAIFYPYTSMGIKIDFLPSMYGSAEKGAQNSFWLREFTFIFMFSPERNIGPIYIFICIILRKEHVSVECLKMSICT